MIKYTSLFSFFLYIKPTKRFKSWLVLLKKTSNGEAKTKSGAARREHQSAQVSVYYLQRVALSHIYHYVWSANNNNVVKRVFQKRIKRG